MGACSGHLVRQRLEPLLFTVRNYRYKELPDISFVEMKLSSSPSDISVDLHLSKPRAQKTGQKVRIQLILSDNRDFAEPPFVRTMSPV